MRPVRENRGPRHEFCLYRSGRESAAVWLHIRWLGRWWGLMVRWDPEIMGSRALWTLADVDVGWRE